MSYPQTRLRRLRTHPWLRRMIREASLSPADLIWPIFVCEGTGVSEEVPTLPGVQRLSIDRAIPALAHMKELGIPATAVFPVPGDDVRTKDGREAFREDNLVCRAISAIKDAHPDIGVIGDVALDPYTTSGHDGIEAEGRILNDETVAALTRQALVLANAGCDIVAPSDMMDGRVGAIRKVLDLDGHEDVAILAYTAKYCSAFYGPFRDAVGSNASLGTSSKATYQMDPANRQEAVREAALDIAEGADMIMVKPALPYLDIIRDLSHQFDTPTFAYHVSGEYAMLAAAANIGVLDFQAGLMESLTAIKRAGARGILTYGALEAAEILSDHS